MVVILDIDLGNMPENVANRMCSSVTKLCDVDQDVVFNLKLSIRQLGKENLISG